MTTTATHVDDDLDLDDILPGAGKTGCLIVPSNEHGHAKYEWDSDDPEDIQEAKKVFEEKKKQGYTFYRVDPKSGDKGSVVKDFDPKAEKLIAVPRMAGG